MPVRRPTSPRSRILVLPLLAAAVVSALVAGGAPAAAATPAQQLAAQRTAAVKALDANVAALTALKAALPRTPVTAAHRTVIAGRADASLARLTPLRTALLKAPSSAALKPLAAQARAGAGLRAVTGLVQRIDAHVLPRGGVASASAALAALKKAYAARGARSAAVEAELRTAAAGLAYARSNAGAGADAVLKLDPLTAAARTAAGRTLAPYEQRVRAGVETATDAVARARAAMA